MRESGRECERERTKKVREREGVNERERGQRK